MSRGVLLALRRKRESFAAAGLTDKLDAIDAWIGVLEAELEDAEAEIPQPPHPHEAAPASAGTGASEWEDMDGREAEAPAGVVLTPAAQALADELGVTLEDLKDHEPSGKAGDFLVSDIRRAAEAKAHTEEEPPDGDD